MSSKTPALIVASLCFGSLALGFGLWRSHVVEKQYDRESRSKLEEIARAMHRYEAVHKRLPPAKIYDKNGKPLHSWRVLLLPFLGENGLYARFKLEEAWDSAHNLPLLESMPTVYRCPSARDQGASTRYQVFDGFRETDNPRKLKERRRGGEYPTSIMERTAFVSDPKYAYPYSPRLRQHWPLQGKAMVFEANADGFRSSGVSVPTGPMILVAEAHVAVPWTKPVDLPYHPDTPLAKLGRRPDRGFNATFVGGETALFVSSDDEAKVRSFIAAIYEWSRGNGNN